MQVWANSTLPNAIAKFVIQSDVAEEIADGKLLASVRVVRTNQMFLELLKEEENLPDRGRYTFVHLLTTHSPYVLEPDCSYNISGWDISRTSRDGSYQCALQLISQFVETLKKLNRYDNSLVVIQADHGNGVFINGERLQGTPVVDDKTKKLWDQRRVKALLLIKPPGKNGKDNFEVSQSETMLVDLFPTIMDMLGIKTNLELDGISLEGTKTIKSRLRQFFNDEGDEFLLQNGTIKVVGK
jgi:hypothetical protein